MERKALVTGGSRGIGRAIAEALVARGYRVAIASRNPEEAAQSLGAVPLPTDLEKDDPKGLVKRALEALGGLHVLVHAAAVNVRKPALELSYEEWRRVLYLHLDVAFLLAQAAAPHMAEAGWGRVLFIGSVTTFTAGGPVPITARIPMGRWARPEEIARVAAVLCGDEAEYLTGQAVAVDGGFLAY